MNVARKQNLANQNNQHW